MKEKLVALVAFECSGLILYQRKTVDLPCRIHAYND